MNACSHFCQTLQYYHLWIYSAAVRSPILLSVLRFCFRFLTPSCPRICRDSPSCINAHVMIWWHYNFLRKVSRLKQEETTCFHVCIFQTLTHCLDQIFLTAASKQKLFCFVILLSLPVGQGGGGRRKCLLSLQYIFLEHMCKYRHSNICHRSNMQFVIILRQTIFL